MARITNILNNISSDLLLRAAMVLMLSLYIVVTSQPTARSINTHFIDIVPQSAVFFDTVIPALFFGALFTLAVTPPKRLTVVASLCVIPQALYAAFSALWWFHEFPNLNHAALTHILVSFILWSWILTKAPSDG